VADECKGVWMVTEMNMLENLRNYHIVLASNSPRRKELLGGLGIDFEVRVLPDIEENYPDTLPVSEIAEYIACEKAAAYRQVMDVNDLVITADTVVVVDSEVLGKPHDVDDARSMLRKISGRSHQVITGVCLTTSKGQRRFSVVTNVTFKQLTDEEINYYIFTYKPFDKAGAYGIQEWIGYIGVTGLEGSYFNVMGLPIQRIYTELSKI
jgi:septum formation protein